MNIDTNITQDMLHKMDVQNLLHGGSSLVSSTLREERTHFELEIRIPGVEADALDVEVKNRELLVQ